MYTRLLATLALFVATSWCHYSTFSTSLCVTEYGPRPVGNVPSTTYSTTLRKTETIEATITPTTTLQLPERTVYAISAVCATSTITLPNTKISTLTSTVTSQATVNVTSFDTVTVVDPATVSVTVTAAQSTTTVPTSPGFIPASSGPRLRKREPSARANVLAGNRPGLVSRSRKSEYPESVQCGVVVIIRTTETKTVTASRTVTATSQSTTTRVYPFTVGVVTTTVVSAGASTTTTVTTTLAPFTNTVVVPTTTTTAATLTFTVQQPEATFYAACAPDNLLTNNPNEGGNITRVNAEVSGELTNSLMADSAYDCCVRCLSYADVLTAAGPPEWDPSPFKCSGGIFLDPSVVGSGGQSNCFLSNPLQFGTCDPTAPMVSVKGDPAAEKPLFTAFSGPCGQVIGARFDPDFERFSIPQD
ncbi:MAG: hypothetical protein Q9183_004039 [Haloplaca sp. 2 TL-2023]